MMLRIGLLLPFVALGVGLCQKAAPPVGPPISPTDVDRARTLLDHSLADKNPDTRMHAVESLGMVGAREPWLSKLDSMVGDKDVQVKLAVISTLVDVKNPRTVASLKKALDSDVPEVSFAAAKALDGLGDAAGKQALLAILAGESKTASGFLTKQKRDALRMFHTPHTMFLFALHQGVNFVPFPGVGAGLSSLNGILSDPSSSGRAAAALLLGNDSSPAVRQALRDAMDDKDWTVRAAAVHSVAMNNDPRAAVELLPMLDDKKEAVQVRAAAGLLRLDLIRSGRPRSGSSCLFCWNPPKAVIIANGSEEGRR